MTGTYDWIVIGNGISGAAASYELAAAGLRVLLVERHIPPQGATRYSYGGIAYWSATTPLTRRLCDAGRSRYATLSDELGQDIEFRELDLILTIAADHDPIAAAHKYADCGTPPKLLSANEACELEPLLDPEAIAGALTVKHGHVNPEAMVAAYNQAMERHGGARHRATVHTLAVEGDRVTGVVTDQGTLSAGHVLLCTGGLTRSLLANAGLHIRQYFTHAELIESPPLDLQLRTLVMPADTQRFDLEAEAGNPKMDDHWDEPGREIVPPILDAGAVQLLNGQMRLGQVSRTLTDPAAPIDSSQSERWMRQAIATVLPKLGDISGTWHRCLVAFSGDRLPLIGPVPGLEGVSVFSGFSNPFAILPPLAQQFATHVTVEPDEVIGLLAPDRPSLVAWR